MTEIKENTDQMPVTAGIRSFILKIGGILAYVLHPAFLFFYCYIWILLSYGIKLSSPDLWLRILVVFMLAVLFPALFPFFYAKDVFLKDRKKRPLTLLFTLVCYIGCLIWIKKYPIYIELNYQHLHSNIRPTLLILLILILGLFIDFIISFWFKVSLHASGAGFIFFLLLLFNYIAFKVYEAFPSILIISDIFLVICCIILLWQRVASESHTLMEVLFGLGTGFLIPNLLILSILRNAYIATSGGTLWSGILIAQYFDFPRFW